MIHVYFGFFYALHTPVLRMRQGGAPCGPFFKLYLSIIFISTNLLFLFQINPTLCLADPVVDVNRVESDYLGIMFLCKVCISN